MTATNSSAVVLDLPTLALQLTGELSQTRDLLRTLEDALVLHRLIDDPDPATRPGHWVPPGRRPNTHRNRSAATTSGLPEPDGQSRPACHEATPCPNDGFRMVACVNLKPSLTVNDRGTT